MAFTRRYDEPEPQRVNRWLAQSGVCSRREAEALIAQGMVAIDGETVADAGRKIEPGQTLTLADAAEIRLEGALTVMLNKPVGIVSAHPEPGQTPAVRLLTRSTLVGESPSIPDRDTRLAPVGRLDMDSHGLLLLSEDGVVAKAVIGPESILEKGIPRSNQGRADGREAGAAAPWSQPGRAGAEAGPGGAGRAAAPPLRPERGPQPTDPAYVRLGGVGGDRPLPPPDRSAAPGRPEGGPLASDHRGGAAQTDHSRRSRVSVRRLPTTPALKSARMRLGS